MYVHVHVCVHVCTRVYMYMCARACARACVHVRARVCVHVRVRARVYVCACVSERVCVRVSVCVCCVGQCISQTCRSPSLFFDDDWDVCFVSTIPEPPLSPPGAFVLFSFVLLDRFVFFLSSDSFDRSPILALLDPSLFSLVSSGTCFGPFLLSFGSWDISFDPSPFFKCLGFGTGLVSTIAVLVAARWLSWFDFSAACLLCLLFGLRFGAKLPSLVSFGARSTPEESLLSRLGELGGRPLLALGCLWEHLSLITPTHGSFGDILSRGLAPPGCSREELGLWTPGPRSVGGIIIGGPAFLGCLREELGRLTSESRSVGDIIIRGLAPLGCSREELGLLTPELRSLVGEVSTANRWSLPPRSDEGVWGILLACWEGTGGDREVGKRGVDVLGELLLL